MKKVISLSLLFSVLTVSFMNGAERAEITPVFFKTIFDGGIQNQDAEEVLSVLVSNHPYAKIFIKNNSLANKLYKILMSETEGEDFDDEVAQGIPFDKILYAARQMAIIGGNERFLAKIPQ